MMQNVDEEKKVSAVDYRDMIEDLEDKLVCLDIQREGTSAE